jgi:hypothetical protein
MIALIYRHGVFPMRSYKPTDTDIAAALADLDAMLDEVPREIKDNWPGNYKDDIATVLRPRPWPGVIRLDAIDEVYGRREARHCNMPKKFEQTVQNAFNKENDRSKAKDRHNDSLLFTSHVFDGQTYWAMRVYRPR